MFMQLQGNFKKQFKEEKRRVFRVLKPPVASRAEYMKKKTSLPNPSNLKSVTWLPQW